MANYDCVAGYLLEFLPINEDSIFELLCGEFFSETHLEHPPSSGSHEVSEYVLINDHVIALVHCTSPRVCLEGRSVWNVPRIQGRVLYSLKHIHVCCSGNMLSKK